MDRNSIIGFVLIGLLLMVFFFYNERQAATVKQEELKHKREAFLDSISRLPARTVDTTAHDTSATALIADTLKKATETVQAGPFIQNATSAAKNYILENEDVKVTVSSKGGEVSSVELKKYKTFDQKPLLLLQDSNIHKTFNFVAGSANVSTTGLNFDGAGPVTQGDTTSLALRISTSDGKYLEQRYSLPKKGYIVNYQVNLVNLNDVIPNNSGYISMDWAHRTPKLEKNKNYENRYSALYYKFKSDEGTEHMSESKDGDATPSTALQWISFKQQFFNSTLISLDKDGFKNATLHSKMDVDSQFLKNYSASVILPYDHQKTETYSMQYYFGPNNYQALKHMDIGLEKILSLGWFAFVSEWLIIPTFNFLEKFISNYGIIILLLTLFVKIILTPLTYRSQLSMAKTKVLKPEIDELKEKYKDDQTKFGSEQMKLYSKAGVNPLSGCIPTLLIMPVLIAMYSFFPASIELRQQGFLWAHDLSTYDSIYHLPISIPWYGDHVSLFTLLMTVTSILYAVANSQLSGAAEGPMKYMPYFFPIMLLGMFNSFPAALTYFYLLNNLISYGQQYLIQKFLIDEKALHRQIQENKKKPAKTGGFAENLRKRLEDAQKQQEQVKKGAKKKS